MTATTSKLDTMDQKTQMREGFEAQRKAGMNVDWFTWQIAWHDALFTVHDIAGDAALARQPAAVGQWVHCSPSLLNAGVSCANTPRRACECNPENGGHDHFIAHAAAPSVEQDERGAFAAIHEFLGIASKRLYPTPDKPNSDWAKLRAAVDALALIHEARAAATSANVDRFDPYRLKVAEECCERLMSACTDAGCPDGVRMDDWIRENVRSTSANVAQNDKQPLADHRIWEIADLVWRRKSITTDRAFELDFAHEVIAAALHEARATSPANVAQGAEAIKSAYRQGFMAGWNGEGEAISAPPSAPPAQAFPYQKTFDAIAAATSVSAGRVAISVIKFREAFGAAPPAQTALTDDVLMQAIADTAARGHVWASRALSNFRAAVREAAKSPDDA